MLECALNYNLKFMEPYTIGDRDDRSWGWYEVDDAGHHQGVEFCEKTLCIHPRQALSLQRHQYRREVWSVLAGSVSVVLDAQLIQLTVGQELEIPKGSVHGAVNLSTRPALIRETQIETCREADNERLCDYAGRSVVSLGLADCRIVESVCLYQSLTKLL